MWDIKTIIEDFFRSKNFQEFINHRYKNTFLRKDARYLYKYIGTDYGIFCIDDMVGTIESSDNDYRIDDMLPTDIVLDIGACIGGFALKSCRKAQHVYAVEPLVSKELRKNIKLNNVQNITVFECSLGIVEYNWKGSKYKNDKYIKQKTLSELINMCGGDVDFLKMDCEGGEWCIKPEELKNIRCIEMELHRHNEKTPKHSVFLKILKDAGFEYEKSMVFSNRTMLIHARRKL